MSRIQLPNNCSITKPIVIPNNWEKSDASLSGKWEIRYRFYDPVSASRFPNGKQIRITGFRICETLAGRRSAIKEMMANEMEKLLKYAFNPITGDAITPADNDHDIDPRMPFPAAMDKALARLTCGKDMKKIVTNCLKVIQKAIRSLYLQHMPISEVRRKHIRIILDEVGRQKNGWSASNFNHHRAYLQMIFNELIELEATEIDPVSKIKKMKQIRKIRKVLTPDERKKVNEHLFANHYTFYRFIHVFFHSGARLAEMVRIRRDDVDLQNQKIFFTIRKGKQAMEVFKTIKDIAMPYWKEILQQPGEFLFSRNLCPGDTEINARQITKRWHDHVKAKPAKEEKRNKNGKPSKNPNKGGLGINADLYSLKHSHTVEMVDMLSANEAAFHNSHADTSMVAKVYDIRHLDRQHDRIRSLNNPL